MIANTSTGADPTAEANEASGSEDKSVDGSAKSSERGGEKKPGPGVSTRRRRVVCATGNTEEKGDVTTEAAGPEKKRGSGGFPLLPRPTKK